MHKHSPKSGCLLTLGALDSSLASSGSQSSVIYKIIFYLHTLIFAPVRECML